MVRIGEQVPHGSKSVAAWHAPSAWICWGKALPLLLVAGVSRCAPCVDVRVSSRIDCFTAVADACAAVEPARRADAVPAAPRLSLLSGTIRRGPFASHCGPVCFQANVPISKFEKDFYLPYERLSNNVKIVRDR